MIKEYLFSVFMVSLFIGSSYAFIERIPLLYVICIAVLANSCIIFGVYMGKGQ